MKRNSTRYSFYISPNLMVRVWTLIRAESLYFIFFTFVSSGLSVGKFLIIFLIHTCFVTFIICLKYLYKLYCFVAVLLFYDKCLAYLLNCLTDSISVKIYWRWIKVYKYIYSCKTYNNCFFATTTFRLFIYPSSGRHTSSYTELLRLTQTGCT
jgi:hypothetical protein